MRKVEILPTRDREAGYGPEGRERYKTQMTGERKRGK